MIEDKELTSKGNSVRVTPKHATSYVWLGPHEAKCGQGCSAFGLRRVRHPIGVNPYPLYHGDGWNHVSGRRWLDSAGMVVKTPYQVTHPNLVRLGFL